MNKKFQSDLKTFLSLAFFCLSVVMIRSPVVTAVVTAVKKKRNRDEISQLNGQTAHQARYAADSQSKDYWLSTKSVQLSHEKIMKAHYRALNAVECYWQSYYDLEKEINDDMEWGEIGDEYGENYEGSQTDRRIAIKYLYIHVYGAAPEDRWRDLRVISGISASKSMSSS